MSERRNHLNSDRMVALNSWYDGLGPRQVRATRERLALDATARLNFRVTKHNIQRVEESRGIKRRGGHLSPQPQSVQHAEPENSVAQGDATATPRVAVSSRVCADLLREGCVMCPPSQRSALSGDDAVITRAELRVDLERGQYVGGRTVCLCRRHFFSTPTDHQ